MLAIDFSTAARRESPSLRLAGALDLATATTLAHVLHAITIAPGGRITLDAAHVRFCDTAGVDALLDAHQRVTSAGATLRVSRPSPSIKSMLRATHCDWLLQDDVQPPATAAPDTLAHTRLWLTHLRGRACPPRPTAGSGRTNGRRLRLCEPVE